MASTTHVKPVSGYVITNITFQNKIYDDMMIYDLCVDIILGLDIQVQHNSVWFKFNGSKPPICDLPILNVEPPDLFYNLSPDCKPIATKYRKYNTSDKTFIKSEIQRLLSEGIIEPSISPWGAQPSISPW